MGLIELTSEEGWIPTDDCCMGWMEQQRHIFSSLKDLDATPAVTDSKCADHLPDDLKLVERIISAYHYSVGRAVPLGDSMWRTFADERHSDIVAILKEGNREKVASILRNPAATELFYGFDNLTASSSSDMDDPVNRTLHAVCCLDGFFRFAYALGAVPVITPEMPADHLFRKTMTPWTGDSILDAIENILKAPLPLPNIYPGEHGLATRRGVLSYRIGFALQQAWRITQLLGGKKNPRVLEIGGGLGRTAFYANHWGVSDYSIVDIPLTSVSQAHFLGHALGEEQVTLAGEERRGKSGGITLLSPEEFLESDETYDLIVNVDSIPEIDPAVALRYWEKIQSSTPLFLSINHEWFPGRTVKELIDKSSCIETVERTPYWMRMGYFEEIVRFTN